MKRKIITTADGSRTIRIEEWDEQYHSIHGALAESYHVFIKNGLFAVELSDISILEMGFGTGLNALITFHEAALAGLKIRYRGIEAYPVEKQEWEALEYAEALGSEDLIRAFKTMHESTWEEEVSISDQFSLTKMKCDMSGFKDDNKFNLIYFDAFGYRVQPELWSKDIFENMYASLQDGGVLVTYAAKGLVRRAMQEVGFSVEKLPGPPGKREMLRAIKKTPTGN